MNQQEILRNIIPGLRADSSITAVMLMGSVAKETQCPSSDLNLFILGDKNKFETDMINGIWVEYLYITHETAQSKLDKTGMEVYHYLGSKIIYDLDGRLIKLMRNAMNKYNSYKVGDRERAELKHNLYSAKIKINSAIINKDNLKADYITTTVSWKIIETVFAINNIPQPPTSGVMQEVTNLKQIPENGWFEKLFGKDTDKRTQTMLSIIDWALLLL